MLFTLFCFIKSQEQLHFDDKGRVILPEPIIVPEYSNNKRQVLDEEWKNIRIKLNMSYVTGEVRDPSMCYEVGQVIKFGNSNLTCTNDMIFSNYNFTNLTITINNLKDFAEKFLKVLPSPNKDYDMDLTVKIIRYPSSSSTVAQAGPSTFNEYMRPTSGFILLNILGIPPEASFFETDSSYYVSTLFHEFTHALNAIRGKYHPRNSMEFYKQSQMFCSLTKYGKKFKFMISPYSHLFAQKHYGVDKFVGDDNTCPSGIEIEDGGGDGTAGVHIKGLTFFTELNIGTAIRGYGVGIEGLTDATIAILQDTGNYICNWSMAQPLVWGNPESQIGGKPIKDFVIGPPQLVYPKQYLFNGNSDYISDNTDPQYVGYDYKYMSMQRSFKAPDCKTISNSAVQKYCDGVGYYNPLNINIFNSDLFNFELIKIPIKKCKKGEAMIPGEGVCHQYICDKYDSFTMITPEYGDINSEFTNITCTKDDPNQTITVKLPGYDDVYKNITCVHPELFCRTVKLSEMHFVRDPFDPNMSVTQLDDPYDESKTKEETNSTSNSEKKSDSNENIKIIVPWVVCGAIIIIAIVVVSIVIIKKMKSNNFNDDNKLQQTDKSKQKEDIEIGLAPDSSTNFLSD